MNFIRAAALAGIALGAPFACVDQTKSPTGTGGGGGAPDASSTGDASPVSDGGAGSDAAPAMPLHTQSRWILDANGRRFKLAGVSWYGGESPGLVPLGLDHADVHAIAHEVKVLGFNSVRLPWCNQLFESNPVVTPAFVSANPALQGKTVLEVFDAVVAAIAQEGMVVVLDNHRSRGDWCCDTAHGDGLWHTVAYPESSFVADWVGMVQRYLSQPLVAAADLRNELRGQLPDDAGPQCVDCDNPGDSGCGCWQPSWGDNDPETDWAAAAERVGDAIQTVNPNLLIIVEGNYYATYLGASYRPVHFTVPDHLVYSPHNYDGSNGGAASFADYAAFKAVMDQNWGFVITPHTAYTAPLWVGEFGASNTSPDTTPPDLPNLTDPNAKWWVYIRQYIIDNDLDWSVWSLNGTQGSGYGRTFGAPETFAVLMPDWTTPAPAPYLQALQAMQAPTLAPDGGN
ncbi:MAG TPA: glycoside hydrolase family 5 protein [Polyangiaceae bacterium]